jgi:BASS family bile acid:Na+ symporter
VPQSVELLVRLLTLAALVLVMVSTGLGIDLEDVVRPLRRWRPVLAGIAANFVLVPLAARLLLDLFGADPMAALGLLILAACPGAPVGPAFAALARGDVPAAVGQMVLLASLSALLAPVVLWLSVPPLPDGSELRIDVLGVIGTLFLSQLLPLAVGLALRRARSGPARRWAGPLGRTANVLLLVVVLLLLVREHESLAAVRLRGWCGMLLLAAASLAIGWACGGPDRAARRTFALTACARNAGVALVVATAQFAGTVVPVAVTAYGLLSILAALAAALLFASLPAPAA